MKAIRSRHLAKRTRRGHGSLWHRELRADVAKMGCSIDMREDLERLMSDIHSRQNPGILGDDLRFIAVSLWKLRCSESIDWNGVYGVWLILGDSLKFQALWRTLPAFGGRPDRSADFGFILELVMYGFWCRVWNVVPFDQLIRSWVTSEMSLGETRPGHLCWPLIHCYLKNEAHQETVNTLAQIRTDSKSASFDDGPYHTDIFPYDMLAPELAYHARQGKPVNSKHRSSGLVRALSKLGAGSKRFNSDAVVTEFPDPKNLTIDPEVERVVVELTQSEYWSIAPKWT
jgi:hypothetical protein